MSLLMKGRWGCEVSDCQRVRLGKRHGEACLCSIIGLDAGWEDESGKYACFPMSQSNTEDLF